MTDIGGSSPLWVKQLPRQVGLGYIADSYLEEREGEPKSMPIGKQNSQSLLL